MPEHQKIRTICSTITTIIAVMNLNDYKCLLPTGLCIIETKIPSYLPIVYGQLIPDSALSLVSA